jgi:hypothetical protein
MSIGRHLLFMFTAVPSSGKPMIAVLAAIAVVALVQLTLYAAGITAVPSYAASVAAGATVLFALRRRPKG